MIIAIALRYKIGLYHPIKKLHEALNNIGTVIPSMNLNHQTRSQHTNNHDISNHHSKLVKMKYGTPPHGLGAFGIGHAK